ncbi:hypothetical protein BDD43_5476 [Mucilaginibacter gracilis]|uniref:Adhesin domain-containing protein n=1 Tax=Mucilaginibacter gracilis TaxID=423350 RepID=A0A495JA21_9SPHI|nr:hypothetical protein [Mucilaginibacter gracilis]RKR85212.1 hypothetical protein BDD43_5476 [Mucilaginibacter gracilis]
MKNTLFCLCCLLAASGYAQTIVTKSYPIKAGQELVLKFDYPKVHVSTWDKSEVLVTAKVNINDDENDSSFTLTDELANGTLYIADKIEGMDKLPHRYTITQNGKKTIFKTKEAFDEYRKTSGAVRSYSQGTDIDITIEVKVPANTATTIKAIYGMVEMANFNGPASIDATYGGIDATLVKTQTGKLQATTSFGEIYSNLDLVLTDKGSRDFFTSITAEPGKGPAYAFKSTYGKIYLRKP